MVSAHFCHAECSVNDSRYGLQAGVFTHDLDKAWYAFEKLDVGGVVVGHVPSIRVDAQVTFLRSVAMDSRRHASTSSCCAIRRSHEISICIVCTLQHGILAITMQVIASSVARQRAKNSSDDEVVAAESSRFSATRFNIHLV